MGIKSFIHSHKVTSLLLAITLIFSLFNFGLNTTFVREVPMGQGLPNEGQTIYGCKTCSGLLPFIGSFSCSTSIFNCIPKFLISFIGYAIIAIIIGLIIDLIIRKIRSKKQ